MLNAFFGKIGKTGRKRIPASNKTQKSRKMSCSPLVENKTHGKETCYTNEALMKIRDAYNSNNPNTRILSDRPHKVFKELKAKLSHCNKEDCWLNELPENERKYLTEHFFAPEQPRSWKNDPNEWLTNFDIANVMKQYETKHKNFRFIGPTPMDFETRVPERGGKQCVWEELCTFSLKGYLEKKIDRIGISFNLDSHDEPGSHWVSMFVDVKDRVIIYFDSASNKTPSEIMDLANKIIKQGKELTKPIKFKYYENYPVTHQKTNTECGMYSLFFLITLLTRKTEFDRRMSMEKSLRLFLKKKIPDKYVEKFRNIYFNP